MLLWLTSLLFLAIPARTQIYDCSTARLQECEANLEALTLKDETKMSIPDLLDKCSKLRKNINCLLNYTTTCLQPEQRVRKSKVINDARKHTYAACEDEDAIKEHWKDNQCFRTPDIQLCNDEFDDRMRNRKPSNSPTELECRYYMNYQRCIRRVVNQKCTPEDEEFIGIYLLDYTSRLAWICSDNYRQVYIQADSAQALKAGQEHYDVVVSRQKKASKESCYSLIKDDSTYCREKLLRDIQEYKATVADEEVKPKVCCAYGSYVHCVRSAAQAKCSSDREQLIDNIIIQTGKLIGLHCENYSYGSSLCSNGWQVAPISILSLLASFIVLFLSHH